jgi:hypothetical protein
MRNLAMVGHLQQAMIPRPDDVIRLYDILLQVRAVAVHVGISFIVICIVL